MSRRSGQGRLADTPFCATARPALDLQISSWARRAQPLASSSCDASYDVSSSCGVSSSCDGASSCDGGESCDGAPLASPLPHRGQGPRRRQKQRRERTSEPKQGPALLVI